MNPLIRRIAVSAGLAGVVWFMSKNNLAVLALLTVILCELPSLRRMPTKADLLSKVPEFILGASVAVLIALYPRAISQLVIAAAYWGWRVWLGRVKVGSSEQLVAALVHQIVLLEALFLAAAIWSPPRVILLVILWVSSFILIYQLLDSRGDRSAALLAAAWALVASEAAWIFLAWLVSYVIAGGYLIVPQATIILGGLTYCSGSIYLAQREGKLSRARLSEYLVIALILVVIVVTGTAWRGTI